MKLYQLGAVLAAATLYSASATAQDDSAPAKAEQTAAVSPPPKASPYRELNFEAIGKKLEKQGKLIHYRTSARRVIATPNAVGRYMFIADLPLKIEVASPKGFQTTINDPELGRFILIYPFPTEPREGVVCGPEFENVGGCGYSDERTFDVLVRIAEIRTVMGRNGSNEQKVPVYRVVVAIDGNKMLRTPEFW